MMFRATYRNTIKNIFRSVTVWLLLFVVQIVCVQNVSGGTYGYFDMTYMETIMDTDPRFVLGEGTFNKHITNSFNAVILYAIPIFCVIITVLILNRDYGDRFFELEKASGVKPLAYVCARLSALVTVGWAVTVLANLVTLHLYVYTRGGVSGMELGTYLTASNLGLLRIALVRGLPTVLLYTCMTYALGALFKSGIAAAVGGLGYALFCYAAKLLFSYKAAEIGLEWFFDWVHPYQQKLLEYLYCYGTEWANPNTTLAEAALCVSLLLVCSLIFAAASYLRVGRRTV
ncbi:MAG: hypothetical protein IJB88_00560 [Clostridia bacterium]|nr:hypothetical protein [Clostridia bacterium]